MTAGNCFLKKKDCYTLCAMALETDISGRAVLLLVKISVLKRMLGVRAPAHGILVVSAASHALSSRPPAQSGAGRRVTVISALVTLLCPTPWGESVSHSFIIIM